MTDQLTDALTRLREDFAAWNFGTTWASAASRPDARRIWARRKWDERLITAWDEPTMREMLRLEGD